MRHENINDNSPFPFFPQPAKGETVYSIFCRCSARTGLQDDCITTEFTGKPQRGNLSLFSGLPSFLPQLAAKMPTGHPWLDKNLIVGDHTTLPYYIYFDAEEERSIWVDKFAETSLSQPLKMSLGISNNPIKALSPHPRYCPTCVDVDLKNLGYPYFKREHQLPGVVVCWQHGTSLVNGCSVCGTYPIKGKALSMAGRCLCEQGITPLQIEGKLPEDTETLHWLAKQSATMVNSSGTGHTDVRTALLREALKQRLGGGAQVKPSRLAEAIEKRFGSEILEWLGTPVWKEGRPSPWVSRVFWVAGRSRRRAPIFNLLVIGTLYGSLEIFEKEAERQKQVELICGNGSLSTPQIKTESIRPAWSKELLCLLQSEQCGLYDISILLGVSLYKLIAEVEWHGWRVILSEKINKEYGAEIIAAIKNELQSGVVKKDIMRRYSCSEWTLRMIELDEPSIKSCRRNAINLSIIEKHRTSLLEYLAINPSATRKDIGTDLPSTYNALIGKDKEWFCKQIPMKKMSSVSNRTGKTMIDWGLFDGQKQVEISEAFDKMLTTNERPVQATANSALKRVGIDATYYVSGEKIPLVAKTLEKRSESYPDFVTRRISWAVAQVAASGELITLKNLALAAALRRQLVKDHKTQIVDLAKKLNAKISMRSFFA